jgi:hypothetical protein
VVVREQNTKCAVPMSIPPPHLTLGGPAKKGTSAKYTHYTKKKKMRKNEALARDYFAECISHYSFLVYSRYLIPPHPPCCLSNAKQPRIICAFHCFFSYTLLLLCVSGKTCSSLHKTSSPPTLNFLPPSLPSSPNHLKCPASFDPKSRAS